MISWFSQNLLFTFNLYRSTEASRFLGVSASLDDAKRGVGELAAGVEGALAAAAELREHAAAARATLERVASSVQWLVVRLLRAHATYIGLDRRS